MARVRQLSWLVKRIASGQRAELANGSIAARSLYKPARTRSVLHGRQPRCSAHANHRIAGLESPYGSFLANQGGQSSVNESISRQRDNRGGGRPADDDR